MPVLTLISAPAGPGEVSGDAPRMSSGRTRDFLASGAPLREIAFWMQRGVPEAAKSLALTDDGASLAHRRVPTGGRLGVIRR
jgi:hypothetical protein